MAITEDEIAFLEEGALLRAVNSGKGIAAEDLGKLFTFVKVPTRVVLGGVRLGFRPLPQVSYSVNYTYLKEILKQEENCNFATLDSFEIVDERIKLLVDISKEIGLETT